MFVSYSQNFEDLMLWRALKDIKNGFYIDIGAQDPIIDSVSLAFHERGWEGVSVEPSPQFAALFREHRPHEVVEQVAIGDGNKLQTLYEFKDTGLSTGDPEIARQHEERGLVANEVHVPSMSLDALLEKCGQRDIHWLKIDVEGLEEAVLRSWNEASARPWILLIEATRPGTPITSYEGWEPLVLSKDYAFAYFDGLNRFYIHQSHSELHAAFVAPPNVFDNFSLSGFASQPFCSIPIQKQKKASARADAAEAANDMLTTTNSELLEKLRHWHAKSLQQDADHTALLHSYVALNASYEAVRNSWSWRVTAPLRVLLRTLLATAKGLRVFINRFIFHAINAFKAPLTRLMSVILKNQRLSSWLNRLIQRFPFLHQHLRTMAVEAGHIDNSNLPHRQPQDSSLTPRATRIEAKLSKLIAQHRSTIDAHHH